MTQEIWKPVVGHEGAYEVSNLGRVRSIDRVVIIHRCDGHTGQQMVVNCPLKGRMLRLKRTKKGYLEVMLRRKGRMRRVHQLVLEAFVGPCPDGQEARHENDVKDDNRLANLLWGTKSENQHDAIKNGRSPIGDDKSNAKLSSEDIPSIRHRLKTEGCIAIAHSFGVSETAIRNIKDGRSWRHVQ